jgi:hypothetical protein
MQKRFVKYFLFFIFCGFLAKGASPYQRLVKADSLYAKKKYSEAYVLYKELFDSGKYTPRMLLKMAYVKEGLGDVADALYYLNIYYVNFPQRNILKKMDSLAKTKGLEGYQYDDINYFLYLYYRYKSEIIIGLVGVLFVFFLSIVSNRVLFKRIPITSPYLFLVMAAFVYLFVNYSSKFFNKGIIVNDKALVMNSPSAGANIVATLPKGTRVHVWGDTDIWYKVSWNGTSAYIRKSNLQPALAADETIETSIFPL